ncbi:MAG TPA: hypothetical protein VF323_02580 [Candidatus Limnocylindrales bacterium]
MTEERDTRSYTERHAAPPPPPPPPTSESMDGRFLAIIGVGLLSAAVVAALVLRGPGTPAVATASPTANAPTASAAPPATPEADDLARQRFWALIEDPKLSYHLDTKGGGRFGSEAYSFSESLDISGDAWKGTELAHGLGSASALQIVVLDTVAWIKFPDGWHKNIEHDPYFRSRPLLDLDSERDLVLSGKTVVRGGQTLFELASTTNYQPYPGRLIGFVAMGMRVDSIVLDILVTDQGVPVEATVHILAGGPGADGKSQFDAKATRTFSKVGAAFTIAAPKP